MIMVQRGQSASGRPEVPLPAAGENLREVGAEELGVAIPGVAVLAGLAVGIGGDLGLAVGVGGDLGSAVGVG